jgi:hypothetical protein
LKPPTSVATVASYYQEDTQNYDFLEAGDGISDQVWMNCTHLNVVAWNVKKHG